MAGLWWNNVLSTSRLWPQQCSVLWNIQKYRNPSVTNAINMFGNNKVAPVLRKLFAFTHHWMFLVWHVSHETPFYRLSVGMEPTNINFHWQGAGLLSNYWSISAGVLAFHAFLHLPFFMCSILFHSILLHNLISELICFAFFVCMDELGSYRDLVNISCQQHL